MMPHELHARHRVPSSRTACEDVLSLDLGENRERMCASAEHVLEIVVCLHAAISAIRFGLPGCSEKAKIEKFV